MRRRSVRVLSRSISVRSRNACCASRSSNAPSDWRRNCANWALSQSDTNQATGIPNEAVNETPQGAFVGVLVNGQPQRREVKVGLQGNTKTEIIDGLQPGEVVVTGRIFNREDEGPSSPFGRPFGPRMGGSSPRGGGQGGPPGGGGR